MPKARCLPNVVGAAAVAGSAEAREALLEAADAGAAHPAHPAHPAERQALLGLLAAHRPELRRLTHKAEASAADAAEHPRRAPVK